MDKKEVDCLRETFFQSKMTLVKRSNSGLIQHDIVMNPKQAEQ